MAASEPSRGATRTGLLLSIVVLVVACGLALLALGAFDQGHAATEELYRPEEPTTTGVPTGRPTFTLAQDQSPELGTNSERSLLEQQAQLKPAVFDGKGTIEGRLFMAPGTPFPERWTLVVEPSRTLNGKELAVRRTQELSGEQPDFRVTGLPQAGYVVRAMAPGMNSTEVNVLLAVGLEHQYVNLKLKPAGFLDGGVTDREGQPLEGVPVVLESVATHVRLETQTDVAGNYLFRDVLDGEYQLFFGAPENPLLPAQTVLFSAPSLRFPTREIPHDGRLTVTVLDNRDIPLEGAHVRGFGPPGGALDARTSPAGEAHFRFLPLGRFKLTVMHDGLTALGTVEVLEGTTAELTLRLED